MNTSFDPYMPPQPLPVSLTDFVEHLKERRSVREFSSRLVERDTLLACIEAAGSAPSGANSQPWFFALIENQDIKDRIREEAESVERRFYQVSASERWLADLKPLRTNEHKPYLSEAPSLIAVFSRPQSTETSSYYPLESTGIATGFLLTALHQAGLATLTHTPKPMGFLNEVLGLDRSYKPFMMVITGYAKAGATIPRLQKKSVSEICKVF